MTGPELEFNVAEFQREIEEFRSLSKPFIDVRSLRHFDRLKQILQQVAQERSDRTHRWEIPLDDPLYTERSAHKYQPDARGKYAVFGEIAFVWNIASGSVRGRFKLSGNASVTCRIRPCSDQPIDCEKIAEWNFDIAALDAPGGFFHLQVPWEIGREDYLKTVDVPRFPAVFVSPLDAIEFVISELFQDDWSRHVAGRAGRGFHRSRKNRMVHLLEWYMNEIRGASATPIVAMKSAKPDSEALLG